MIDLDGLEIPAFIRRSNFHRVRLVRRKRDGEAVVRMRRLVRLLFETPEEREIRAAREYLARFDGADKWWLDRQWVERGRG